MGSGTGQSLRRLTVFVRAAIAAALMSAVLSVTLIVSGCAPPLQEQPITQVVPDIPSDTTSFGPLYPRLNGYLNASSPNVAAAVRDTLAWARDHLDGFSQGVCASTSVVYDAEFSRIFGRTTLGVTLPWMQIYIRDGNRGGDDGFLWKDPSLFVSTILHETVHAIQRARQSQSFLRTSGDCDSGRRELERRRATWNSGFESLRGSGRLGGGFAAEEQSLLYRWVSPIERARDEVEAALVTIQWMSGHSEDLNAFTIGGANNWAYGVQYLSQLKTLASSPCFSPDDDTYEEERRIYTEEIPMFVAEFQRIERQMRHYITQHGSIPALRIQLSELQPTPAPSGRDGARCALAASSELPHFPVPADMHFHEE